MEEVLTLLTYWDPQLCFSLDDSEEPCCEATVVGWSIPAPEGFTWLASERIADPPYWRAVTKVPDGAIKGKIPVSRVITSAPESVTA